MLRDFYANFRDSARLPRRSLGEGGLLRSVENHHFAESRGITLFLCPKVTEKCLTSAGVQLGVADAQVLIDLDVVQPNGVPGVELQLNG